MFNNIIITCKGSSKEIRQIEELISQQLEEEVVISGKTLKIEETDSIDSFESVEKFAVNLSTTFEKMSFKLTATIEEKDYLCNVQIIYDGCFVKAYNSNYYQIVSLPDEIKTFDEYQKSGINLKLTEKTFNEIKAGKSDIYNLRPDAKKPKLAIKIPMNNERIIYPKKRIINIPVDAIGDVDVSYIKDEFGTEIIAEMKIEIDGELIYLFERHYDTMKLLQFFVTEESVRFFWEKKDKTDEEIKHYEKIMAIAIEEFDSGFDFSSVCVYDGAFKKQLFELHKAIEKKALDLGTAVTSSWQM